MANPLAQQTTAIEHDDWTPSMPPTDLIFDDNAYQPINPDERGWLWCESLGLWLGPWAGNH
jgi:hypothetical protein